MSGIYREMDRQKDRPWLTELLKQSSAFTEQQSEEGDKEGTAKERELPSGDSL